MKNTKTPFATKTKILADLHLDYRDKEPDWTPLGEFYEDPENSHVFALAFAIQIGEAIPTDKGTEIINKYFDLICDLADIKEDRELSYKDF